MSMRACAPWRSALHRGAGLGRGRSAFVCRAGPSTDGPRPLARRVLLGAGVASGLISVPRTGHAADDYDRREGEIHYTEEEWRKRLTPDQYRVLRKAATERPGTSPLNNEKRKGTFVCGGCGNPLFQSAAKFDSGTGWPSFFEPIPGAVLDVPDYSIPFLPRVETRCAKCQGHLGHVFEDGPLPTGLRYCMNGLALNFTPATA